MRIFVSGANGFIGRAFCSHLLSLGYSVVPAVRRSVGIPGEVVVTDNSSLGSALEGCQSVVHLAGRTESGQCREFEHLVDFRIDNVDYTINLVSHAIIAGVQRFVFMSTIKVIGEETSRGARFLPDDSPAPKNSYALSKWEAEQKLRDISERTELEIVIVRSPLVYGPGVTGNFSSLIRWIKKGVPLPVGSRENRRSIIALDNLIDFLALCADRRESPDAKGLTFQVADAEDVSTRELLHRVAKAYGLSVRLVPLPAKLIFLFAKILGKKSVGDRFVKSLVIDVSRAREVLGWQPRISLDEQLNKMFLHDTIS